MQSAIVRLLSQALRAYRGDRWRPSACRSKIFVDPQVYEALYREQRHAKRLGQLMQWRRCDSKG